MEPVLWMKSGNRDTQGHAWICISCRSRPRTDLGEVWRPPCHYGTCPDSVLPPAAWSSVSKCDWLRLERLDKQIDRVALRALKREQTTSGFFQELLKAQKQNSKLKRSLGLSKLLLYLKCKQCSFWAQKPQILIDSQLILTKNKAIHWNWAHFSDSFNPKMSFLASLGPKISNLSYFEVKTLKSEFADRRYDAYDEAFSLPYHGQMNLG
jgi:hypothetical protein